MDSAGERWYGRAVGQFLGWCSLMLPSVRRSVREARGLGLRDSLAAPRRRLHPDAPPTSWAAEVGTGASSGSQSDLPAAGPPLRWLNNRSYFFGRAE